MCVCIRKISSFLIILNATPLSKDIYRLCFPGDPRGIKILSTSKSVILHPNKAKTLLKVYGLFCMEILQTCMLSSDSFHWLVDGWGHLDILENYYMSWFDVPIMVGIISCTVHSFFAWRIYILSKSFILPAFIFTVSGCFVCLLISGF